MISKTKINKRMKNKRNPTLAEAIFIAKKNNNLDLAKKLSRSTRKHAAINLSELSELKEDKVIIVGRILGGGEIKKKMSVYALGFSSQAKEKLAKAGCETKTIYEEIKKNPKLSGVKVI
jgi:large subunit ribosomal protein L18e